MTASPPAKEPTRKLTPEEWRHAVDFITSNLPLTEVQGTGLRLHLAGPRSGLSRLVPPGGTPYWAHAWPGGIALAQHIAAHPETVRGRAIWEIGAGSGLVALAALRAGADTVVALDTDPLAAISVRLNAEANGLPPPVAITATRIHRPSRRTQGEAVVLAGDVFYGEEVARDTASALDAAAAVLGAGTTILVGDIGRRHLPLNRLEPLASYPVRDVGDPPSAPLREGRVFRWRHP